jgi:BMFP domain-containing protein YqiC
MQTRNRIMEDVSQLMTNAMGVAQGAKAEAETALNSMIDRWLADRDFVTREEFEAVRAMAQKAREENEALKARIAALEAKGRTDAGSAGCESFPFRPATAQTPSRDRPILSVGPLQL